MKQTRLQRSLKATFLGLLANVALAAGKLIAGVAGHSQALIADGVESVADVLSSLIVWRSLVVAATPADADHPYGHGKAEPLAAAIVSILVLVAALWISVQAVRGIIQPVGTPAPYTLAVVLAVFAIKETLFRYAVRQSVKLQNTAILSDAWHHRADAITSLCAAVGIAVTLWGGPGYEAADAWGAMVAAIIIGWMGARVLRPALNELMDVAPNLVVNARIRDLGESVAGVARVEKCVVRKMGFQYFVDMHVEVDPEMSVQAAHRIAHEVRDKVRGGVADVADVLVHVEPIGAGEGD